MSSALIYHDVLQGPDPDETGFPGPLAARYKLTLDRFEAHLEAIAAAGVAVVPLPAPGRTCTVSFDDGGASALLAATRLEHRGWRGHFFVTTGRIGKPGFLTAEQVRELARRGHQVGSHSHTHPTYMGKLGRSTIAEEWRRSRHELHEVLGSPPATASVPGGLLSPDVIEEAAKAGYRLLMTSEPTSRLSNHAGLALMGRYTIWSTTPARQASGYARGAPGPRARLWLEWNAKGLAKRASPRAYQALRRLRARA